MYNIFQRDSGLLASAAFSVLLLALFWHPVPKQGTIWEPFNEGKLEEAKQAGRPAILDFYAEWCAPCHELERSTYSDPQVAAALSNFKRLKTDVTDPSKPEAQKVIEAFDVSGVPAVLFLAPDGTEVKEARVLGYVPPGEFLKIVRCAAATWETAADFSECRGTQGVS